MMVLRSVVLVIILVFVHFVHQSWTISPTQLHQINALNEWRHLQQPLKKLPQQQELQQQHGQLKHQNELLYIIHKENAPHIKQWLERQKERAKNPKKSYDEVHDKGEDGISMRGVGIGEAEESDYRRAVHSSAQMPSNTTATTAAHVRKRREYAEWFIAPNTRWCGRGNIANGTYNQLGGASAADKCCRRHDHCVHFIPAMSGRYDLFNYRPYTLSHCSCDRRFRTCLKMAGDEDANTIGKLFFNMVQTQCFILRNEKVCQKRGAEGHCEATHVKQKAYLKNNKKY